MTPDQFRGARRRLGYTQTQMAAALGVHPRSVTRWELGERHIAQPVEMAVQALLDVAGPRLYRTGRTGDRDSGQEPDGGSSGH